MELRIEMRPLKNLEMKAGEGFSMLKGIFPGARAHVSM